MLVSVLGLMFRFAMPKQRLETFLFGVWCRYPAYHNISPYSVAAASSMHRLALRTTPAMASMQNSIFGSAEITAGAASVAARYVSDEARTVSFWTYCFPLRSSNLPECFVQQILFLHFFFAAWHVPAGGAMRIEDCCASCAVVEAMNWRRGWRLGSCCCSPSTRTANAPCAWAACTTRGPAPPEVRTLLAVCVGYHCPVLGCCRLVLCQPVS